MNEFHKYTDEIYLDRDQVEEIIGPKKIVEYWKKEQKYRRSFVFDYGINSKYGEMKLTQTTWMMFKEVKTISEISTMNNNTMISIGNKYYMREALTESYNRTVTKDIRLLLSMEDIKIPLYTIQQLVNNEVKPSTEKEERAMFWYYTLQSLTMQTESPHQLFRMIDENNEFTFTEDYNKLLELIDSELVGSDLALSSLIYFYMKSSDMFGDKTEMVILLSFYTYMMNSYASSLMYSIPLIEWMHNKREGIDEAYKQSVDSKADLTYVYQELLSLAFEVAVDSEKQFNKIVKSSWKQLDITLREKNSSIRKLVKENPSISTKEAKFFINNSQKGEYYTIDDYRLYNSTSYETARTSLESLVNKGFYKKTKVGKKFVFST